MTKALFAPKSLLCVLRDGKAISLLGVLFYWTLLNHYHALKIEHFVVGLLTVILFWGGGKLAKWRALLFPLLLTGMVYDSQRLYSDLLRGTIHVVEPYQFDRYFFGMRSANQILTPNEWWQNHLHPLLDFLCGFAYLVFIPEFFLVVFYFLFCLGEKESKLAYRMSWGFFWLNILGYSTYYWYAAAPPWYVAAHGFGPADLTTPASLGGCALIFYVWVSFSAVYLNHHYILDILWGTTYALFIGAAPEAIQIYKSRAAEMGLLNARSAD